MRVAVQVTQIRTPDGGLHDVQDYFARRPQHTAKVGKVDCWTGQHMPLVHREIAPGKTACGAKPHILMPRILCATVTCPSCRLPGKHRRIRVNVVRREAARA